MKKMLLLLLSLPSLTAGSQENSRSLALDSCKIHCYVNGTRLDSVESVYGELYWWRGNYCFSYGREATIREMRLADEKGKVLVFQSSIALFNLLHYNGWELVESYKDSTDPDHRVYWLRKRAIHQ